jgi:hypothetical protein
MVLEPIFKGSRVSHNQGFPDSGLRFSLFSGLGKRWSPLPDGGMGGRQEKIGGAGFKSLFERGVGSVVRQEMRLIQARRDLCRGDIMNFRIILSGIPQPLDGVWWRRLKPAATFFLFFPSGGTDKSLPDTTGI